MTVDDRFVMPEPTDEEPEGIRSEIITGPVSDWATDFSHLEPEWAADPYPIQDDLRQRCPIAHTDRFGGAWLPTRYEDVAAIAYDTERFSSRSIIMGNFRPPADIAPIGGSPPISSDPPFHQHARKLLLGAFTKTAISRQEPATRAFCHELIDKFQDEMRTSGADWQFVNFGGAVHCFAEPDEHNAVPGCNFNPAAYKRSVFLMHGFFNEAFAKK